MGWLSVYLWVFGLAKCLPVGVWVAYVVACGCLGWLSNCLWVFGLAKRCLWVFGLAKWLPVAVWVG